MTHQAVSHSSDVARLTGVGVGPGDPRFLTLGALEVLRSADRVVAPTTDVSMPGRAETIVRGAVAELEIERLLFDMSSGHEMSATARRASHAAAARRLLRWLGRGEHVAFVTLGDPNVYSTFAALVEALGLLGWQGEVVTVPGVTAFQVLAARTGTVLLDGSESLALVTALDDTAALEEALEDPERAVVVYKCGRRLDDVARVLAERGRLAGAVFGERLGMDDERTGLLAQSGEGPASYLATVIVPPTARSSDGDRR